MGHKAVAGGGQQQKKGIVDQRGVVGLVLLGIVMVVLVVMAGFYVYRVRSGQARPLFGGAVTTDRPSHHAPDAPAILNKD
jgi:hypothetical protein